MSIMVTKENFTSTWSNPVWESLEYDVKLEAARILKLAGSVAGLLPPPHTDVLQLAHPGPLFEPVPQHWWARRIATIVGGCTATAVCLACAFGVNATWAAFELCWQQCADYCHVWPGAEAVAPVVEVPTDGENYIMLSPGAQAASSVDAAGTRTPRQAS